MEASRRGFLVAGLAAAFMLPALKSPGAKPQPPAPVPQDEPRMETLLEIEDAAGSGRFVEIPEVHSLEITRSMDYVIEEFVGGPPRRHPGLVDFRATLAVFGTPENQDFVETWLHSGEARAIRVNYDHGYADTCQAWVRDCRSTFDYGVRLMELHLQLAPPVRAADPRRRAHLPPLPQRALPRRRRAA